MTSRERVLAYLSRAPHDGRPVLPIYPCLYRAPAERMALRDLYAERFGRNGSIPVDFDTHIALRMEARLRADARVGEDPDWIDVGFAEGPEDCDGAHLQVDGTALLWSGPRQDDPIDLCAPPPTVGAWHTDLDPTDFAAIDAALPVPEPQELLASGRLELARRLIEHNAGERFVVSQPLGAPFWSAYGLLGFQGLMELIARGDYVALRYIMERSLARTHSFMMAMARVGVEGVFVEECLASDDIISPTAYQRYALPYECRIVETAQLCRLKPVLYFCGGVGHRLTHLASLEAGALAFEESKKGFRIDIGNVRTVVGPKVPLLGNTDVMLIHRGDAMALETEIRRQAEAAGSGPFAHSFGSPLPLDTPPENAALFARLVRETRDSHLFRERGSELSTVVVSHSRNR